MRSGRFGRRAGINVDGMQTAVRDQVLNHRIHALLALHRAQTPEQLAHGGDGDVITIAVHADGTTFQTGFQQCLQAGQIHTGTAHIVPLERFGFHLTRLETPLSAKPAMLPESPPPDYRPPRYNGPLPAPKLLMTDTDFIPSGLRTVRIEAEAVSGLSTAIDTHFQAACRLMLACSGRVVVTGMGKSGHIGRKIAATLASTGTPAFFVHPGEASHGDMGMITAQDVVLALSNSGSTQEILTIVPLIRRLHVPLIAMTGKPDSPLALAADAHLCVAVPSEACPLGLAPTSSTTASLVMGDALAIALLEARGFTAEDFAFSHPGGALGRKLLLKVSDVMRGGDAIPRVSPATTVREALVEISAKGLGMTTVTDERGCLLGVFTDGDLRRLLDQGADVHRLHLQDAMHRQPHTLPADALAVDALNRLEDHKISSLIITDTDQRIVGVLHLHDLLRAGLA